MKTPDRYLKTTQGSAFITVIIVMAIMAALSASIISYSLTEQRLNERNRLVLNTRNMAENIANYAAAQLSTKLYRLRSTSPIEYVKGANKIYLPDADNILATEYGTAAVEVYAGLTSSTDLTYIDPTLTANASNTYSGLSVITCKVPVVAKATLTHPLLGSYTAYTQQDLSVAEIPLYQFAIFYNYLALEFGPGGDMIISGPVHSNDHLIARDQDTKTNTLQFKDRVTCVGDFYAHVTKIGAIYMNDGSPNNNPGGSGHLYFQNSAGTVTDIYGSGKWRDHAMSALGTGTPTDSTVQAFASFATNAYGGNFRTRAHDVTALSLPGTAPDPGNSTRKNVSRTVIEPAVTGESPGLVQSKFSRRAGLYIIVNPSASATGSRPGIMPDGSTVLIDDFTYRCWLNSVDSDNVSHTVEVVLPGQPSYGPSGSMTKNILPNRYTNVTAIGSNQVLRIPIDPTASIYTPESTYPYATPASAGRNLGIDATYPLPSPATTGYNATYPTSLTSFSDGYFYDLRRSDGSNGYGTLATKRSVVAFNPRPIAKIDFDMTRFKLTVERTMLLSTTSTEIYNPDVPTPANWSNNVLNHDATKSTYGLAPRTGASGSYVYTAFPADATGKNTSDPFRIYKAVTAEPVTSGDLLSTTADATPWYDGIAIYIHSVDAEDKSTDAGIRKRTDSGVRFWNGRGSAATLTNTGRTGFSIATNDAAYIIGHFNADGSINSNSADGTSPGGYSARYPESATEKLCNVMADSLTILSQPEYVKNGSGDTAYYTQSIGWSDTRSANRFASASWSSSWQTTDPSSSNMYDGTDKTQYAGRMPNEGAHTAAAGDAEYIAPNTSFINSSKVRKPYTYSSAPGSSLKFSGSDTEISSCLLQGIVRTTSEKYPRGKEYDNTPLTYQTLGYQNSGGAHNFPRLSENWSGDLYIRGSMVAMFESEVACEPWLATRIYSAPGRMWGLHNNLRAENSSTGAHDVPLEPMLINVSRWHFTALNSASYDTLKGTIMALPDE
jgi:hypothetical protein